MTIAQIIAVSVLAAILLAVLWNIRGHPRLGDDSPKGDYGASDAGGAESD